MELMEKVKQVGESYELNKLKTQNRTIELDARLSSERLFATKVRLHQVSQENEKLNKQLRNTQQHLRQLEKKLLLTETMLRQFVDNNSTAVGPKPGTGSTSGSGDNNNSNNNNSGSKTNLNEAARLKLGGSTSSGGKLKAPPGRLVRFDGDDARKQPPAPIDRLGRQLDDDDDDGRPLRADPTAAGGRSGSPELEVGVASASQSTAQAQPTSRARTIINDLRQRLNFGGGGWNRAPELNLRAGDQQQMSGRADAAIQADELDELAESSSLYDLDGLDYEEPAGIERLIDEPTEIMIRRRRRSVSLDAFLNNSVVRDVGDQRLIISRGWPPAAMRRQNRRDSHSQHRIRSHASDQHHRHHHQRRRRTSSLNGRLRPDEVQGVSRLGEHGGLQRRRSVINDLQKRRLLIEYLKQSPGQSGGGGVQAGKATKLSPPRASRPRRLSIVQRGQSPTQVIVQYDLPVHDSKKAIALGQGEPGRKAEK